MGEGDLPKALDQVNGKFLVRYELGLFGFPKPSITLGSFTTNPKKEVVIGTDSEWTYVSESSTGECPMKSMGLR